MNASFIVGYSLFLGVVIALSLLLVTYTIYNTNQIFTKPKLSPTILVPVCVVIAFFIGLVSYFSYEYNKTAEHIYVLHISFDVTFIVLYAAILTAYILINKHVCLNKIDIVKYNEIDWQKKIDDIKSKYDVEVIKNKLISKHSKYFEVMKAQYERILQRLDDKNLKLSDKLADIVCFNEVYSLKWSKKLNIYCQILTFEFLNICKKN